MGNTVSHDYISRYKYTFRLPRYLLLFSKSFLHNRQMRKSVFTVSVLLTLGIPVLFLIGSVQLDSVTDFANQVLSSIATAGSSIPANFTEKNDVLKCFNLLLELIPKYLATENFLEIGYLLFTPTEPTQHYLLEQTQKSLNDSTYNSSLDTKILVHGFQAPLTKTNVFFDIKNQLLLEGDYNVIVVNWTHYNKPPYVAASANAVLVGFDIAHLVNFLMESYGVTTKSFHIIGHSLGAHVSGFAGKAIHNLGRITGLDAAGPLFQIFPSSFRLANTDATFVDSIHTNGAELIGYGMKKAYADIDFFPNGGSVQSGCKNHASFLDTNDKNVTVTNELNKISCSHDRAPSLFEESINNTRCHFLSVLCKSYKDFKKGKCSSNNSTVAEMGFHAKPIPSLPKESKFYLNTSSQYPYCIPTKENHIKSK